MINNIRFKIIAGKINKIPEFYTIFFRKMPDNIIRQRDRGQAEAKSLRPRPMPKFWPRGHFGVEDLTSLEGVHENRNYRYRKPFMPRTSLAGVRGPSLPSPGKNEFGIGGDAISRCLEGLTCTLQTLLSRSSISFSILTPTPPHYFYANLDELRLRDLYFQKVERYVSIRPYHGTASGSYAERDTGIATPPICLSVRPSVRPSHSRVVSKPLNILSKFLRNPVAPFI